MYVKDYLICHSDPFAAFSGWCPTKAQAWHTHPMAEVSGDHIVTLELTSVHVRDELEAMEKAGTITLLPTLTSGNPIGSSLAAHPTFVAAGIASTTRTWDAAKALLSHIEWQPLHPDR